MTIKVERYGLTLTLQTNTETHSLLSDFMTPQELYEILNDAMSILTTTIKSKMENRDNS